MGADTREISSIVFWELSKLIQLGRVELDLESPEINRLFSILTIWPIDRKICRTINELDFKSDPADELIAATSLAYDIPLLTRDRKIAKSRRVPLAN